MHANTEEPEKGHVGASAPQSLATEHFFYFFLRLRKPEIRRTVQALRARYPRETSEQLARRIIESYTSVSFLGGALMHLPFLLPGIGQALQLLGFVGGASALTRMHLYLILEIALAYGKDIDDEARVPEMAAVVAATGIAAGAPLALQVLDVNPLFALPASGLTAAAVAHLIGETAIQYYARGTEGGQGRCAEPPGAATIDAPNPKPERIPSTPGEPSGMETHEALFPESDEVRLEPAEQPITVTLESPPPEPAATPERPPRAASPTAPARRRKRPIRTRPATT